MATLGWARGPTGVIFDVLALATRWHPLRTRVGRDRAVLLRRNEPAYAVTTAAFVLEVIGVLIGGMTAWLGGELVDRLGVGVDDGAHLNAPNSLSHRPAGAGSIVQPVGPPRSNS